MRKDEGSGKYHSGATIARGGQSFSTRLPFHSLRNFHSPSSASLPQIDHPFVVNLRYAFQDDENCFFVLDLMLGGDLRCTLTFVLSRTFQYSLAPLFHSRDLVHLERLGSLPEESVRYYVAEIASALAFLHEHRIMHRCVPLFSLSHYLIALSISDIKPDNILLDERGHAHLTDFNIAVHFTERRMLTGVAGSMAYMAPEILSKRGYTYPIDWWSLGVCAYELVFGRRPFRGKTNADLTHSISKDSLRFPDDADKRCSRAGMMALKGVSQACCPTSCADCSSVLRT